MNGYLVVKLGGTTVASQTTVLAEIASVARERAVVVVHGGGSQVTEWLARLGQPTRFEDGLRVTDEASMEVVTAVLRGSVNTALVAALRGLGVDAVGLSGVDGGLLVGERLPGRGLVATVASVRRALIDALVADGGMPRVLERAMAGDDIGTRIVADAAAQPAAATAREHVS
ncbi:MAG: hypothetical protein ACHQ02_07245 [Candidatus Limnocylindrales bacterium]